MTELLGLSNMKLFNHRSAGATREMLLILGQVIKHVTLEKVKRATCFTLHSDEVCDIANNEQLITFIKYIDPDSNHTISIHQESSDKFRVTQSWNNKINCVDTNGRVKLKV